MRKESDEIMGLFSKSEMINASELSNRIKPFFITAYDICREFGFEEGKYFNYQYKDKTITICHSCLDNNKTIDAFSPGKTVHIDYKGRCVFDCTIKLNGTIKSKVFETGEWISYFSLLKEMRETTISARDLLSTLYEFGGNHLFAIGRDRKVPGANINGYSFNNGRISITYDLYKGWMYADKKMKVKFDRNEEKNVASAAVITFMGDIVFNAVHFFPSNKRPFSSNTKCKVYKRGNWEKYLADVMINIKTLFGI